MYWFYHEYLDEARRFRIHRINCETEQEARKLHRQACEFRWVTEHVEPSVSSLFVKTEGGQRALIPGHRPGERYRTEFRPVPAPDYIREKMRKLVNVNEAALSGVRATDDRNPVLPPPAPARTPAKPDRHDTPF